MLTKYRVEGYTKFMKEMAMIVRYSPEQLKARQ